MDSYGVGGTASPTVMNTIFYENTSDTNVGAMYVWGGNAGGNANPTLINCIFANNAALNGYGGAFIADSLDESGGTTSGSCTITMQNCIVRNNTATGDGPQFYVRGTNSQILATFSNFDMTAQVTPHEISGIGTGNIDSDPLFNDISNALGVDGCWMTSDDGLQLVAGSASINTGDNTSTHTTDILGASRIVDGTVDMGAYEYQSTLHLNQITPKALKIYPNPIYDKLYIESETSDISVIKISNILGNLIKDVELKVTSNVYVLDLSALQPGLYFIEINNSIFKFYKK